MPALKLTPQFSGNIAVFKSACPEADALFTLLGRQTLKTNELHFLNRMGFDIEYIGNLKPLYESVGKKNVEGNKIKPEYFKKDE